MIRDPNPTPHIRTIIVSLVLILGLALFAVNEATAAEAYYNPQGSPLPTKEMEVAIRYAAESAWSQRIDEGAVYAGLTGEESTEDSIVVRWAYFPLPEGSALMEDAGLVAHSANYSANNVTLANARWWTDQDGELVKGVISINIAEATETVDKCMYELLTHEFGHTFLPHSEHSEHKEDVMFWSRGDCRYSPSLSDLAMFKKPLKSCHVELTPHGDLEVLDFNGKRYVLPPLTLSGSLEPPRFGRWILGIFYDNPAPRRCNGLVVDGSDVWAEVKGFGVVPTVLRLVSDKGLFRAVPTSAR